MTGIRKLSYYLERYGEEEGNRRFQQAEVARRKKEKREAAGRGSDPRASYTMADVESGDAIPCRECGEIKTRLQWTHFNEKKCTGKVTSIAAYREKYPDAPIVAPNLKAKAAITLETLTALYGDEEGQRRWDAYRNKQAESNTLEYKKEKHGWTEEQFREYNQSRAATKENLISRHGEEKGREMWEAYRKRQRYTCSREYFIEQYGEEEGAAKFDHWAKSRIQDAPSEVEIQFCDAIDEHFGIVGERQIVVGSDGKYLSADYCFPESKCLVEFYGDFWHTNPTKYTSAQYIEQLGTSVQEIWDKDARRMEHFIQHGYQVKIVWEADWRNDPQAVLDEITKWWG